MSLYILKLIKDINIPFKSKLICFTGSNEETGMQDMQNYLKKHNAPNFSLVADTAFPLYRGNKGILRCEIKANSPLEDILYIQGGKAMNIVLGQAEMALRFTDEIYRWLNERISNRIKLRIDNDKIILHATGISKHGALPEGSINAGWLLANLLKDCPFICENDKNQMQFLSCALSDIYGEKLGIASEDPDFGKLTCSNGIIKTENKKIFFTLDMRVGKTVNLEQVKKTLRQNFLRRDFRIDFSVERPANITAEDNPYIQICLNTYKEFTGDTKAQTRINAGGTYAMQLPCAAEIGTTTVWGCPTAMPCGHGGAHQPDECINIDGFLEAIELTALMVLACDKVEG
jgi:succinyl-diaminopimelate desuccinylase